MAENKSQWRKSTSPRGQVDDGPQMGGVVDEIRLHRCACRDAVIDMLMYCDWDETNDCQGRLFQPWLQSGCSA